MTKKITFNQLFQNNKFVLLISLLAAVCVWLLVVINISPQTTRVIKNVEVNIDESLSSQMGYTIYGNKEFTVDVTVKGKKYQISGASLSADDIVVTADAGNVNSAGDHFLKLKAEPGSSNASYSIVNLSETSIQVHFDESKRRVFSSSEIEFDENKLAADGYIYKDLILPYQIIFEGPATEINKITGVVAVFELDAPLTAKDKVSTRYEPASASGINMEFVKTYIVEKEEDATKELSPNDKNSVVIPILRVKPLTTKVTFSDVPSDLAGDLPSYVISPSVANFGIDPSEGDDKTTQIIGSVSFNQLSPLRDAPVISAEGTGVADADAEDFTVKVNLKGYTEKEISYRSSMVNIDNPLSYRVDLTALEGENIIVVGKPDDLEKLTAADITITADISAVVFGEAESHKTIPVNINVKNNSCWIYGTYYMTVYAQ